MRRRLPTMLGHRGENSSGARRAARRRLLAFILFALAASGPYGAAAQQGGCAISRIDGADVALWRDGSWREAVPGSLTSGDAMIRTGHESRAELLCADGFALTVGVATEATIESLVASTRQSRNVVIRLFVGVLGLVAPAPRNGRTEIRGPLAIASARSTEWLVTVAPDAATAVFVRDGAVAVTPTAPPGARAHAPSVGASLLGPGDGVDVTPDGGAGPVTRWGAARIARTGEALGFGWR